MSDREKRRDAEVANFFNEDAAYSEKVLASIFFRRGQEDVRSNLHELTTEELLKDERVKRLVEALYHAIGKFNAVLDEQNYTKALDVAKILRQALAEWESEC